MRSCFVVALSPRLALVMVLAACGSPKCELQGDRASNDGACPAGETCSASVKGLDFRGAGLGDRLGFGWGAGAWVPPIAVGGEQTIEVDTMKDEPYPGSFDARTAPAGQLEAVATPPTVALKALAPGKAWLRIVLRGTDTLLDRVELEAAPIDVVALRASDFYGGEDVPLAVLVGRPADLTFALRDAAGHRLVDVGLALGSTAGVTTERRGWDTFRVTTTAAGSVDLPVSAGGAVRTVALSSVTAVDAIDVAEATPGCTEAKGGPITTRVDLDVFVCVRPRAGDALVVTDIEVTQPSVASAYVYRDFGDEFPPGLVVVHGTAVGTGVMTVTAGGASTDVTVIVTP